MLPHCTPPAAVCKDREMQPHSQLKSSPLQAGLEPGTGGSEGQCQ